MFDHFLNRGHWDSFSSFSFLPFFFFFFFSSFLFFPFLFFSGVLKCGDDHKNKNGNQPGAEEPLAHLSHANGVEDAVVARQAAGLLGRRRLVQLDLLDLFEHEPGAPAHNQQEKGAEQHVAQVADDVVERIEGPQRIRAFCAQNKKKKKEKKEKEKERTERKKKRRKKKKQKEEERSKKRGGDDDDTPKLTN